jgi:hypothetical protein
MPSTHLNNVLPKTTKHRRDSNQRKPTRAKLNKQRFFGMLAAEPGDDRTLKTKIPPKAFERLVLDTSHRPAVHKYIKKSPKNDPLRLKIEAIIDQYENPKKPVVESTFVKSKKIRKTREEALNSLPTLTFYQQIVQAIESGPYDKTSLLAIVNGNESNLEHKLALLSGSKPALFQTLREAWGKDDEVLLAAERLAAHREAKIAQHFRRSSNDNGSGPKAQEKVRTPRVSKSEMLETALRGSPTLSTLQHIFPRPGMLRAALADAADDNPSLVLAFARNARHQAPKPLQRFLGGVVRASEPSRGDSNHSYLISRFNEPLSRPVTPDEVARIVLSRTGGNLRALRNLGLEEYAYG